MIRHGPVLRVPGEQPALTAARCRERRRPGTPRVGPPVTAKRPGLGPGERVHLVDERLTLGDELLRLRLVDHLPVEPGSLEERDHLAR